MRANRCAACNTFVHVDPKPSSQLFADRLSLEHHLPAHTTGAGLTGNFVQRRVRQGTDRIEAEIAPKFDPDIVTNVVADPRCEASAFESVA